MGDYIILAAVLIVFAYLFYKMKLLDEFLCSIRKKIDSENTANVKADDLTESNPDTDNKGKTISSEDKHGTVGAAWNSKTHKPFVHGINHRAALPIMRNERYESRNWSRK